MLRVALRSLVVLVVLLTGGMARAYDRGIEIAAKQAESAAAREIVLYLMAGGLISES